MERSAIFRIALLFNANKAYDRQIIEGVGEYIQASQALWDVFIADDYRSDIQRLEEWTFDGIIADMDDASSEAYLGRLPVPVVGVGGSYHQSSSYPALPYVATDNYALVRSAFHHLLQKGLRYFALYSFPESQNKRWALERELAFEALLHEGDHQGKIYRGYDIDVNNWQQAQNALMAWVKALPEGTGIIAVTDSRARHLLQVCEYLEIPVPEKIAIIGIDNEELARYLSRISLSSVVQGCRQMGYQAAKLLHLQLRQMPLPTQQIIVPPARVIARRSTDYLSVVDPCVIRAMHFIRNHACKGIKTEQVLDHVGLSCTNLDARFRQSLGQSIHEMIHHQKLESARQLLITTALSINEIADVTGYRSLQYFHAVFKKAYAVTPLVYRSRWHNPEENSDADHTL